jgi:hypothetical protein
MDSVHPLPSRLLHNYWAAKQNACCLLAALLITSTLLRTCRPSHPIDIRPASKRFDSPKLLGGLYARCITVSLLTYALTRIYMGIDGAFNEEVLSSFSHSYRYSLHACGAAR